MLEWIVDWGFVGVYKNAKQRKVFHKLALVELMMMENESLTVC